MLTWVCSNAVYVVTLGVGFKCTFLWATGHRYIELFLNSRASPPPGVPVGVGRGAPLPRGGAVGGVPRYPSQSTWTDPRAQVGSVTLHIHVCMW